jgi:CHAT domain-containing protein
LERALGPKHPNVGTALNNLAGLYFGQGDWRQAALHWRRATGVLTHRVSRSSTILQGVRGKKKNEAAQHDWYFSGLIKSVFRDEKSQKDLQARGKEMFVTAQWAKNSEAASSLAKMAARGAADDPQLGKLIRERQDLVDEWQSRDKARSGFAALHPSKRDKAKEVANTNRLTEIDKRIAVIDERLKQDFPDYAAIAQPKPLSIKETQKLLGDDEALVLFFDIDDRFKPTPEETFIWVVTKTESRWVRSKLGTAALTREVKALRCGLDASAWAKAPHCAKLLDTGFSEADARAGKPLPFDQARAHKLYKALFGQAEDLIKGKHLLVVPSGPLTQLPFQTLVTAPPMGAEHKSARWLARDHAVTILPAVSSLKALRRVARPSAATKPLIGFGNPLLDGDQEHPQYGAYYSKQARLARNNQQCRATALQRMASLVGWRGVTPVETRGRLADTATIRMQTPLPETTQELCAVARDLKVDAKELRLGARATEHEVKRLSASGQLAQYRIVHFATHGALAGELKGSSEPGLLLTPPTKASEDDDGYLSAGEIAGLKLDANWVILSACNTAAGDAKGAQALSGLARAFIYAQARALLVSHWAVNSDATVKLITGAMREMARDANVGRSEALRRSMLALIDKGDAREAHPANWAPFIVVGEGAR